MQENMGKVKNRPIHREILYNIYHTYEVIPQEIYPYIKRVYVRAAFENIDIGYEKYLLESYEIKIF